MLDRTGYLDVYSDDLPPTRVLDLTGKTDLSHEEKGMLTAAVDPEFSEYPFLYVYYTANGQLETDNSRGLLVRFPIVNGHAVHEEQLIILDMRRPNLSGGHWGGQIRFGLDRMLYLGIGDSNCFECAQSLDSLHGKIIRIDVRGGSLSQPYRIPDDNPFVGTPDARPEVWAYGVRNPWRMAFDPHDGRLWVGDVGQQNAEEVTIVAAGENLGWPVFEGFTCLIPDESITYNYGADIESFACSDFEEGLIEPVVSYDHTQGDCAVVGGVAYRGATMPWLNGIYLFGDFCSGRVWALDGSAESGWRMIQIEGPGQTPQFVWH